MTLSPPLSRLTIASQGGGGEEREIRRRLALTEIGALKRPHDLTTPRLSLSRLSFRRRQVLVLHPQVKSCFVIPPRPIASQVARGNFGLVQAELLIPTSFSLSLRVLSNGNRVGRMGDLPEEVIVI